MLWHLKRAALSTGAMVTLEEAARITLLWWAEAMRPARPREVLLDDAAPPVLVSPAASVTLRATLQSQASGP